MNQYVCMGRRTPTEKFDNPEVYKMTIFAPNEVVAESRFWYYLNSLKKIKKAHGQFIGAKLVPEDDTDVKNFGVQLRYRSSVGHHNMYREIRETTASRAVAKLFQDMAGLYHIRYQDIQIIKVSTIADEDVKRVKTMQMIPTETHEVKFPHPFADATIKRNAKKLRFVRRLPRAEI